MNAAMMLHAWWMGLLAPAKHSTRSKRVPTKAAAKQLGVTREHLSRVLHGHRESKRLTRRYADLTGKQEGRP